MGASLPGSRDGFRRMRRTGQVFDLTSMFLHRGGPMAGEAARDVARSQREKAARLERSADMWGRGAGGGAGTAAALRGLEQQGWTTFHDVRWPGRPRANIDHIVIGPGGVFVIDSKNWSGDVRVVGDVLYQGSWRREREVAAAADAALAVTQVLQGLLATPVLCM